MLVVLGMTSWAGGGGAAARARERGGGRPARCAAPALVTASLPVATYLAGLVPWERPGRRCPRWSAPSSSPTCRGAVAVLGPWRAHPRPAAGGRGLTLATLVLDVLTGSNLELNGLFGYDAIVAGRFTGYGNLSFGLLSVSALLVTAAVATLVGRRAGPERLGRATVGTVVGCGLVTVGVIGAPGLGRDFGGVLSALPGFLLLAHAAGARPRDRRGSALILGAAVVAVGTVAYLDWLPPGGGAQPPRPVRRAAAHRRGVDGGQPQGEANLDILLGSPLAKMLPVALLAAFWLVRPGGLLRRPATAPAGPGGLPAADVVALRAACSPAR